MKKNVLLFLLLLMTPSVFFGQTRKTFTQHYTIRKAKIEIVYQALKADDSIKDGSYQYYRDNKLLTEGFYAADQKDSTWKSYGKTLVATRQYDHGKRTGVWNFYTGSGELEWSYSFEDKKTWMPEGARKLTDTTTYYYQDETGQWKRDKMDVNPVPLYGVAEYFYFITWRLYYPQAAQDKEEQGVVQVAINVDENGKATDWNIAKSPAASLNEVSLEVVKDFYHEFIPAEKDGKRVKCIYYKPVIFKLETAHY